MRQAISATAALVTALGCGGGQVAVTPQAPTPHTTAALAPPPKLPAPARPIVPPHLALLAGLMPLRSTGADEFRRAYPTYDGRGVLVAILDSGLDPGLPGFQRTTTGDRKIVDLRDFSGEGRIPLVVVMPSETGTITVGQRTLSGVGTLAGRALPPYYAGTFRELPLGKVPAADVNGNGTNTDAFVVLMARASDGWIVMTDTDGDGSLADERAVRDYAVAGETFSYRWGPTAKDPGPVTIAVNISESDGKPVLDFYFDNSSHGSHVAGIAVGHRMFEVDGFDGVAPGAQLLGLKIANDARGGISVTGSMVRAMEYAADVARRRGQPLILNLSFGIGNAAEGAAVIDSLVDAFALAHPEALFVISAGNDGPGLSTLGFPGSAQLALTACALYPGVFAQAPEPGVPTVPDALGWWSARGGEVAKPDVCAPGVAFSNVPVWHTGEEISGGTSMAAPQVSGAAALIASALVQTGRTVRAADLKRAMMVTAEPLGRAPAVEQGAGVPDVTEAFLWLVAAHQTGLYRIEALPDGGNSSRASGAYRRTGLASESDTVQRFVVTSVGGQSAARLLLSSDQPWLRTPPVVELRGGPAAVTLTYDAAAVREPGLYVGTVRARPATDTLGGTAFELTNTIVVPRRLDQPFQSRETLPAGRTARYFFDVPAGAGGLEVTLEVRSTSQQATLYLFEPDGAPHRGGNSANAGGGEPRRATLVVAAHDVVPGVYEVVVLAPPTQSASYQIEAALPTVTVDQLTPAPQVTLANRGAEPTSVVLEAALTGVTRGFRLDRGDGAPHLIRATRPAWASELIVDVEVAAETWLRLTDFGVTVFDSAGQQVSQGPLNYPFGRQLVSLDSVPAGMPITIELLPGFARVAPAGGWSASAQLTFVARQPVALRLTQPGDNASLTVPAGAVATFKFDSPSATFGELEGFRPVLRATARGQSGPASVRQSGI